jgi:hypothetical protein
VTVSAFDQARDQVDALAVPVAALLVIVPIWSF